MSMITCKECGKEISSSAKVCPNCGKQLKPSDARIIIGCILILIGIPTFFSGIWNMTNSETNKTQSTFFSFSNNIVTKENYEKIKEGMIEQEVKSILGEPSQSSQMENEQLKAKIKLKRYQSGNKIINIYFNDGKVYMKDCTEL